MGEWPGAIPKHDSIVIKILPEPCFVQIRKSKNYFILPIGPAKKNKGLKCIRWCNKTGTGFRLKIIKTAFWLKNLQGNSINARQNGPNGELSLQVAPLIPDETFLVMFLMLNFFNKKTFTSFIWDQFCHLADDGLLLDKYFELVELMAIKDLSH